MILLPGCLCRPRGTVALIPFLLLATQPSPAAGQSLDTLQSLNGWHAVHTHGEGQWEAHPRREERRSGPSEIAGKSRFRLLKGPVERILSTYIALPQWVLAHQSRRPQLGGILGKFGAGARPR